VVTRRMPGTPGGTLELRIRREAGRRDRRSMRRKSLHRTSGRLSIITVNQATNPWDRESRTSSVAWMRSCRQQHRSQFLGKRLLARRLRRRPERNTRARGWVSAVCVGARCEMNERYVVTFHNGRNVRLYADDEDEAAQLARDRVRAQGENWGGVAFVEKVGARGKFFRSQYQYARENPMSSVRRRRSTNRNPISPSETNWLLIGLGALAVGGLGYVVYTYWQPSGSGASWSPGASAQQGVVNQVMAANTSMGGTAPTASDMIQLNSILAGAPAAYTASLPAGTTPTAAGYQSWAPNYVLQQFGSPGAQGASS
jgi:hypothetical protein